MEPTEYLVLLIDPNLDTHPALPTTPSQLATVNSIAHAETLSNTSSQSLCSSTSTTSTATSHTSTTSSTARLSPLRKTQRSPRSKSKSTGASDSRSRSESRSSDGCGQLSSILQLAGLKVLTTATFEAAMTLLEHRSPNEARPMLLLVDVDGDSYLPSPHARSGLHQDRKLPKGLNGDYGVEKLAQENVQRHLRATSDSTVTKPFHSRSRRPLSKSTRQNGLTALEFLDNVLQGLAKGTLHHVVPIAVSSTTSQDKIAELFNLGVADVVLKPIQQQVARTLFLNVLRYNKYRTAVTIPRYTSQKNTLALPSHSRLRNVFLKDQWLSDILISHYCPTPSKLSLQDFPSMSSLGAKERVAHLKKRLLSWDFHPHDLCEEDLMRCVVIVIQEVMKLDGLGDLNIPEHLLHRFVIGLRDSYHRSNPYHNFAHAVDVLQATFYFLCRMGKLPLSGSGYHPLPPTSTDSDSLSPGSESESTPSKDGPPGEGEEGAPKPIRVQDFLRPEDIFALVVASIGHDVGHPGVNNMFLINAHTPLAQIYNDRSVLESFHSMALFQVMKKHGFECFDVDSQNRKFMEFRKMVVSTILATDMGLHFDYVGKIKEQNERLRVRNTPAGQVPKPNQASIDEQERLVLCGTLIKCADISNASRPFHVAERWSSVLLQEMCNQADIEKEMAVSSGSQPVPDVQTKSLANDPGMQIDSQLGFIHGFAMPLFASVKEIIPEMSYCVDLLQINHKIWQDRKTDYLQNGGSGPLPFKMAKPVKEAADSPPNSPSPRKTGAHNRARSQAPKQPETAVNGGGPETAGTSKVPNGTVRRIPKPTNTSSEGLPGGSSIPRPRSRPKAATAEGEVLPKTFGQESRLNGTSRLQPNGRVRQQSSRESVTRITSTGNPVSVPSTPSGSRPRISASRLEAGISPLGQEGDSAQKIETPSKLTPRGQRSPGRRSQGPQQGHGTQSQGSHLKHEKTITLSLGKGGVRSTSLEHGEAIVLGSLLPVEILPKSASSDKSTATSSPLSPPLPRTPGSAKAASPGLSYSGKRIHQKQDYFGPQATATTAAAQDSH